MSYFDWAIARCEGAVRTTLFTLTLLLVSLLVSASGAQAPARPGSQPTPQSDPQSNPQTHPQPSDHPTISSSGDEIRERQAQELARKANRDRQSALRSDTDKLLKLAVELKDYVDKSNENVLSLAVMKKADEIEKLARSVKDKMKGPN